MGNAGAPPWAGGEVVPWAWEEAGGGAAPWLQGEPRRHTMEGVGVGPVCRAGGGLPCLLHAGRAGVRVRECVRVHTRRCCGCMLGCGAGDVQENERDLCVACWEDWCVHLRSGMPA